MWLATQSAYQLDLRTPGIIPSLASSRKQMRQSPKSRKKAWPRPQRKQRFLARVENFGFLRDRTHVDVFAILNKVPPHFVRISLTSLLVGALPANKETSGQHEVLGCMHNNKKTLKSQWQSAGGSVAAARPFPIRKTPDSEGFCLEYALKTILFNWLQQAQRVRTLPQAVE